MRKKYLLPMLMTWQYTQQARKFEQMEQRGWQLTGEVVFWKFRRCEPKTVRYAINYCPNQKELAPAPTIQELEFSDYCRAEGWELVMSTNKRRIFRNENPDAVDLETDPMIQLDNLRSVMRRTLLRPLVFFLVYTLFSICNACSMLSTQFASAFAGGIGGFLLLMELLLCGVCVVILWQLLAYLLWMHRARIIARDEDRLPDTPNCLGYRLFVLFFWLAAVAVALLAGNALLMLLGFLLAALLLACLLQEFSCFLKRKGIPAAGNLILSALCFLVLFAALTTGLFLPGLQNARWGSDEVAVLTAADLGLTAQDEEDAWCEATSSLLATHTQAGYSTNAGGISYDTYTVRFAPLYHTLMTFAVAEYSSLTLECMETEPEVAGTQADGYTCWIYLHYWSDGSCSMVHILLNDTTLAVIYADFTLTAEQLDTAAEKLLS